MASEGCVSLSVQTLEAISREGHGRELQASSELIGALTAMARRIDEQDARAIIAIALVRLAGELDASLEFRLH
jgi:hypothetical protein